MTMQDVLDLHRAGWSREEILAMMQPQQVQKPQPQQPQQVQQPQPQQPQQVQKPQQPQQPQQVQQPQQPQQPGQESETVQLLREMLGMFRTNNINNMGGAPQSVDAAEILAANDYGMEVKS